MAWDFSTSMHQGETPRYSKAIWYNDHALETEFYACQHLTVCVCKSLSHSQSHFSLGAMELINIILRVILLNNGPE